MDEMIPRLWLAAFLGVLLGVGMAYANSTSLPVAPTANTKLPAQTFEVARQTVITAQPIQSNSQLTLLSLLVGIIVATPAFLIAKRRD
jgi:hypothetical protein